MLKTKDLQAEESSRDLDIEESRPEKIRCSSCRYVFFPYDGPRSDALCWGCARARNEGNFVTRN